MNTLIDAWNWYEATRRNLARMQRLGRKHWGDPSLETASIWRDDEFRMLDASEIVKETTTSLKPIDDLAIVVLFSVFESHVRDHLAERMKPEKEMLTDPILMEAAVDAMQGVEEGSFFQRVLRPLKEQDRVSADLVTRVDQVRSYRNWVAHGRRERDALINRVTPRMAYDRLNEFIAALSITVASEQKQSQRPE
ncbi:MAG: hypothetical protein K2R98_01220 [Gemmataceae bacterium]|nr:hypothetical protein [Gemmataceae bacterium]